MEHNKNYVKRGRKLFLEVERVVPHPLSAIAGDC